jgi:aerobic carbon-monoxide dehydrogenase medium subunit
MKPAAFDFVRASSVAETTRLLRECENGARVIAGAQSLGPMLNLRLSQPRLLVDITGIPELTRIEDDAEAVTIGACVTTANIEDGRLPGSGLHALARIACGIAYRAVRNRGTVGGSLCHADPSADWLTVMNAVGAECIITGPQAQRRLPLDQFITGAYQTALAPDEILEAIRLRRLSADGRLGYVKICRKVGEFAMAMAAVRRDPEQGSVRIAIGATNSRPIVVADGTGLCRSDGELNEAAVFQLFDRHGLTDRTNRHQQLAALSRAYRQAVTA